MILPSAGIKLRPISPIRSPTASPTALVFASARGSALASTMMISLAFMMIIASTLSFSLSERRLNYREAMRLDARNSAEAVSEYGLAQIRQKMENRSDFSPTRFTAGGTANAISMPPASFWNGSTAVTSSQELIIGLISAVTPSSSTTLYYYDPTDPANATDPLKGMFAFRFDLQVISKTTIQPPNSIAGGPQTCCITQTLSARAAPLFSHASFYNMDMEIAPGPTMNLLGATHINGNLYVKKQSSNGRALNFVGPVSTSGNLYAAVKCNVTNTDGTSDDFTTYTDNVYFSTVAGGLVGLRDTTTKIWRDQKMGQAAETTATDASFRTFAAQTYGGNLQTILHGVLPSNPPGIGTYVQSTYPYTGTHASVNTAHLMIEPPVASTDPAYSADIEVQKYSTQSGIYICVNPTPADRNGHKPDGSVIVIPAGVMLTGVYNYRAFLKDGTEICLPGQKKWGALNATPNGTGNASAVSIITIRPDEMYDMRRTNLIWTSPRSTSNRYDPKNITMIDVDMIALKLAVDKTINGLTTSSVYGVPFSNTYSPLCPGNGTLTSAAAWTTYIYNPTAVTATVNLTTSNNSINVAATGAPIPVTSWNGAIYIESVDANQQPLNSDGTNNLSYRNGGLMFHNNSPSLLLATSYYTGGLLGGPSGVRLINGRGHVASDTAGSGLSIATNDNAYILGHYNTDGTIDSSTTGTTNSGRYFETGENPCSISCDSLTILSTPKYANNGSTISQSLGWNDGLSIMRTSSSGSIATWRTTPPSSSNSMDGDGATGSNFPSNPAWRTPYDKNPATSGTLASGLTQKYGGNDTEISSAFLAGIVPSNLNGNGQNSGGAHNYPRFLEDYAVTGTQYTLAIRGSFVAMFETRAGLDPYNWRTYSNAPQRLWGFNELFNQGRFPPLTPRVMSYRRVNFNDIDLVSYNALKSAWNL